MATGSGSGSGSGDAACALGVARSVLNALADSGLNVEERQRVCAGVLQALLSQQSQAAAAEPTDAVESSIVDAEDVQQRVEASWLVLHERLRASGPTIDDAAALEAQRWIERVALAVVRSGRQDAQAACDFIGLNAIGPLVALCGDQGGVRAALEEATLQLLDDVAVARGATESSRVLAARIRWVASFLAASGEAGVVPARVVQRFLSLVRDHPQPSTRATAVLGFCPALVEVLKRDAGLCMDVWRLVVELDGLGLLDHQRDALAMLCVLYDCIRPLLAAPAEQTGLWRLLYRGLSCEGCSAVRKRSLFALGRELELASATASPGHPATVWWGRFLSAYDTLENVIETHLLQQVFPIVLALAEEAFGAAAAPTEAVAGANDDGCLLPAPSAMWAEVLLQRALHCSNYPVQRVYLRWFFSQSRGSGEASEEEETVGGGESAGAGIGEMQPPPRAVLDVRRLSEGFVLTHLFPGMQELNNMREEKGALLRDIARFLAAYVVGRQEQGGLEGGRGFLHALLAYTRDGTKSAMVRMAILGFVEQEGVLECALPCLGVPELEVARAALALFQGDHNQAVGHRLAEGVFACCERFTDGGALAAAPGAAESVRALLLELPVKLSLHAWRERISAWLGRLGGGAADGLAWWRDATARGVEALLSPTDDGQNATPSASSSCALACFFLRTPDDMHVALASCLHVLERLHSHPYIPPQAQRAALVLLRNLGLLLRQAPHAALGDILRPCLGEPIDFLVAATTAAVGSSAEEDESGEAEALFRFHVDVLGVALGLAAQLGFAICSSVLGLVEACASTIGDEGASASPVAGRRAVLVLHSLLESVAQSDARQQGRGAAPLLLAIGERFDSLKQCLDAAATRRPPANMAGFSAYISDVWHCRALLFQLQGLPSLRERLDVPEEMDLLLAALDTAREGSLYDVLFCLKCILAPYILSAADAAGRCARLEAIVGLLLRSMDEANYTRGVAGVCIDMVLDTPFLADAALCKDAEGPVRRFFHRVVQISTTKKAYLLVDLAARFVAVSKRVGQAAALAAASSSSSAPPALCFVEELVELVTMREQDASLNHRADEMEEPNAPVASSGGGEQRVGEEEKEIQTFPYVRMTVLSFLADLFQDERQRPVLDRLLLALFDKAAAVDVRKAQIAGSAAFSAKLRAWQALAVLAPFVHAHILPDVNARLYEAMQVVTLTHIRWHMEMLNAYLCMRYPAVGVPLLIAHVATVDVRPQVSASLLVVVGLLCLTKDTLFDGDGQLPEAFVLPVLKVVLPWLSGTHVTTRVICQMVAFRLLSRARESGLLPSGSGGGGGGGLDDAYLNGTLDFLQGNREMSILRRKELRRFEAVSVVGNCSVAGVMGHAFAEGEFTATHLEIALREGMTQLIKQMEDEAAYPMMTQPAAKRDLYALHSDVSSARSLLERTGADATYAIQKKIVVSDVLQGLPREEPKRFENARGERLQDIVICASLLDRLPNLAGMARTCEIFGAKTLVIPDLRVTKEALFQSISSSAERWVPMVQVKDVETRDYLRRMKRDGYTVVGLEQTSTSRCLTRVALPRKMLLLLGREKEGVPVELLAEVDMLVEIPQLGLVRSLNVHVSASLILWEYMRQHRFAGPVKE